ncbi:3D domain-containing protein [Halobacillus yeomjeoni]|uniref:3D domain-containing protein n=1 Tax=Halobacillus yeomjeoni TaxID=311194 RepID=UPI00296AFDCC|nr:3D domain-containing protein [Halobacillus yeomjeoni]
MKKLSFLLFAVTLYTGLMVNFQTQSHTIFAEEKTQESIKNAQEMVTKKIEIDDKSTDHTRFEKDKNKKPSQSEVKRTVNVEATAYTAFCDGCSGITYTGIDLRSNPDRKVIAVDPDVIPLGSKVRVPGYGVAVAGDIGGDIQGNRIDVFIPQQGQALDFGRRQIQVEIIS